MFVTGISHKTTPVGVREKFFFSSSELETVLSKLKRDDPSKEIVILSTCNRTEIYSGSKNERIGSEDDPIQFLQNRLREENLENFLYRKSEKDMAGHLFSVAAGLDSLVLGENEILKQIKDAYLLSQKLGLTGKLLNVLFQRALYVGKMVRTHTLIGQGAVSVGSVAVSLAEKIFGDLSKTTVLIFGAGKMAELSARSLLSKKVKKILVANRTIAKAIPLAEKFNAQPFSLEEGLKQIALVDIIITSSTVTEPLISREFVEGVMVQRQNRSLFFIDISVPRNVDPSVHQIDNVYLYNIDNLQTIAQENIRNRSTEIEKANTIVREKTAEFFNWYLSWKSGEEKSLKHQVEEVLK